MRLTTALTLSLVSITAAYAAPILPQSYTYIVGPQGGNPYPDSGNELTDGVIPERSWGTRTITNFAQAAPWSGWQFVNPQIRFDFDRTVDIGSLRLTADDGNGAAGVFFPQGVTIEAGGQTVQRDIADPDGAGPDSALFTGLNLTGDSLTLTVDGGARNWTMLGEVEFDSHDFTFEGLLPSTTNSLSARIESPFGTVLSTLSEVRSNIEQLVIDPADNQQYNVTVTGELFIPPSSNEVLNQLSVSTADASIDATLLAVNDFANDGSRIDQIDAALGRNRVELNTQDGLFGSLRSFADATVGWEDYFVIEGEADATGTLILRFDVEGALAGDDARIVFNVEANDENGNALTALNPYVASAATHQTRGYFSDPYEVSVPFTYNQVFQLGAVLNASASGNSAIEFLNTVEINQFIIPDGATLRSAADESGAFDAANYNVITQSLADTVPLPSSLAMLLLALLGFRIQRHR